MSNGSATLFAVVLSVCFAAGGVSGVVVAVMMESPETIDIPEGTLIVPENGEPYYYFENGIVITNQVFEVPIDNSENFIVVWPENYVPRSDNFVIIFAGWDICAPTIAIVWSDNYAVKPGDNITIVWADNYVPFSDNFVIVWGEPCENIYVVGVSTWSSP